MNLVLEYSGAADDYCDIYIYIYIFKIQFQGLYTTKSNILFIYCMIENKKQLKKH